MDCLLVSFVGIDWLECRRNSWSRTRCARTGSSDVLIRRRREPANDGSRSALHLADSRRLSN